MNKDMNKKSEEDVSGVESAIPELSGSKKRLKERYPDVSPEDDGAWDDVYGRYMDESESELGKYKDAEGQLTELCRVYPEFAELLHDMLVNKLPLRAAIARLFSQEDLLPQEGDDDFEAYQRAFGERSELAKKREVQSGEIDGNEAKSLETIDGFCSERGLTDEQKDELIEVINSDFVELLNKRITREMLDGYLKRMSFDVAVKEAEHVGEVRGKNGVIEATRVKRRGLEAGDGLPGSGGGGAMNPSEKMKAKSFFDVPERRGI